MTSAGPDEILAMLDEAGAAALDATGPEEALRALTTRCHARLGDRDAEHGPGNLRDGETQFFVAGAFLITPDRRYHMLAASVNFPAEQQRLMIPLDGGHLGWVEQHRTSLLLRNTDEDRGFRQYLKTARMGSSMYAPMFWRGEMLGQVVMAAQARNTLRAVDLACLKICARIAAALWIAQDGPAWLAAAYPPDKPYLVGADGLSG